MSVELICDFLHLHPDVVRMAASSSRAKPVLVTDAISATHAPDGTYQLGPLPVRVQDGVPRLTNGALAGSTLTLDVALRNFVSAGFSVPEAVAAAASRPARLLNRDREFGSIQEGLAADLVLLDADLRLQQGMHRGVLLDDHSNTTPKSGGSGTVPLLK